VLLTRQAAELGVHGFLAVTPYYSKPPMEGVRRHFGAHDPPSTLLGVAVLGYEHQLVEVEAIAALP